MYTVLDLFAGCGGLGLGFKIVDGYEIKLANDIWEPAMKTYKYNNPHVPFVLADIKDLEEDLLKQYFPNGVDVIIGGPPCQGFSMCGTRDINDNRNTLFYQYARIVNITNPRLFMMENVKGLLSMKNPDGKSVIEEIYKEFDKIGYKIAHQVINAKYYGVPQARERVIIIGIRKDINGEFAYPQPILDEENAYTVKDALSCLPNENSRSGELKAKYENSSTYLNLVKGNKGVWNHEIPTHKKDVEERMAFVPQGGNWQNIPEEYRVGGIHSNAYRRLDESKPCVTIKHAYKSMIIHPKYNRCLSIREVARLQSFPDDYIFMDTKTSQYQQLANAVPPLLAKAFADRIKQFLDQTSGQASLNNVAVINKMTLKNKVDDMGQINLFEV